MPKLTEKQSAKVFAAVEDATGADIVTAINTIKMSPTVVNLKDTRRALVKQLKIVDKALAVYDINLALDDAKALVEKAAAKK